MSSMIKEHENETERKQWYDKISRSYRKEEAGTTTLLFGGLTMMHDSLIEGAMRGLGYRLKALDCPNLESLQVGREFGNRGQCNPTYFTVGNLIKYLRKLERDGKSKQEIINDYYLLLPDRADRADLVRI
ncbi:MAG: hypothetical protein LRY71_01040 [Bacillaceae bacterium]|nr:hypothetical protein [Bacillaceae bacterium]